jgi:two-component system, NtrC family, response regulator AtoC
MMLCALVIDGDLNSLQLLAELLEREGFTTITATSLRAAQVHLSKACPDVVLIDPALPDGNGIDFLKDLEGSSTAVILMTRCTGVDTAVEASQLEVSDYLTKPVDVPRLRTVLANVARTSELKEDIELLRQQRSKLDHFGRLLGASPAMQEVYDLITRVAPTDVTVLLTGESGTGKELIAQTLHTLSRRRKGPFLPLNCGAISPNLIESELFGHERGSFTGANRLHRGYFERATEGTLFLDEISEMPIELQVKLLRVVETGTFVRIGGDHEVATDVRVVAATNRLPEEAAAEGKLRPDLLYRLMAFPIYLPPLRDRGGDVELLSHHFLEILNATEGSNKRFASAALERLRTYTWPGNVRELRNVVQRAFIMSDDEISLECLPPEVLGLAPLSGPYLHIRVGTSLAEVEQRLILATLNRYGQSKDKTARVLGISLKTLYNRLNNHKRARGGPWGSAADGAEAK